MKNPNIIEGRRMWTWFILLFIPIGFLVALFSGSLQIKRNIRTNAPLEQFTAHMEECIPALMKRYRIPGCNIALVMDREIVWTQAYGYADVEIGRALTVATPMSVQSITKSITAWGVMRLDEKGLIDLDAPLSQYLKRWQLPQPNYGPEKITIRQLLSHSSGMPLGDFSNVYSPGDTMPSNRDVMTEEAVLLREPGAGFSYSNVGFNLLELMIEDVTGQGFSEYMRTEILLPLGMENAAFDIDRAAAAYLPTAYDLNKKPVPVYLYPSKASGGLFATAEEIARFTAAGMKQNPVLETESIERMYQPESDKLGIHGLIFDGYGLGHYLETLPNGMRSISHGGQGNGIMTHFQIVPDTGDAIVILTNSQRSWPLFAYLLSDWAQWRAFPAVGMGRIVWGHYGLSAIIGMLISTSLLIMLRLTTGFYWHKRVRFRVFRLGAAMLLLGSLVWCAFQEYLIISSIFPTLTIWLGSTVLALSITLLLSVLLPLQGRRKNVS